MMFQDEIITGLKSLGKWSLAVIIAMAVVFMNVEMLRNDVVSDSLLYNLQYKVKYNKPSRVHVVVANEGLKPLASISGEVFSNITMKASDDNTSIEWAVGEGRRVAFQYKGELMPDERITFTVAYENSEKAVEPLVRVYCRETIGANVDEFKGHNVAVARRLTNSIRAFNLVILKGLLLPYLIIGAVITAILLGIGKLRRRVSRSRMFD